MKPIIDKTLIFAHRGASAYEPDNTMEAFELAHKTGADGIEPDVRLTSDGEVVIFHDNTLDRVTNMRGTIPEYTLAELRQWTSDTDFSRTSERATRSRLLTRCTIWWHLLI